MFLEYVSFIILLFFDSKHSNNFEQSKNCPQYCFLINQMHHCPSDELVRAHKQDLTKAGAGGTFHVDLPLNFSVRRAFLIICRTIDINEIFYESLSTFRS